MPIYEYHCGSCGKDFERFQKITDPPLTACPECGKKVSRTISQTSFTLKGGGWFKDGYSQSPPGEKNKEGKKSEKIPEKKETKPEPKET